MENAATPLNVSSRFLVKLVSPTGRVVSEQKHDDPQAAMLAFSGLAGSRFGDDLGAGSYVVLVDEQLEFGARRIAEGMGCYSSQFYRPAGGALFQQIEKRELEGSQPAGEVFEPVVVRAGR